jgi:hypothetical protein
MEYSSSDRDVKPSLYQFATITDVRSIMSKRLTSSRWFLTISMVAVVVYIAAIRVDAQAVNQSFIISISSPKTTLESGVSIRLDITIENHLDKVLFLASSETGDMARSGITVLKSDGSSVEPLYKPQPGDRISGQVIGLGPHKSALNL